MEKNFSTVNVPGKCKFIQQNIKAQMTLLITIALSAT